MTFGDTLIRLREEKGIGRRQFAEILGIPYTTLRNYETGAREPGHLFLIAIARHFGVSIDYLLGIETIEKATPEQIRSGVNDAIENDIFSRFARLPPEEQRSALDYAEFLIYQRDTKNSVIPKAPDK